MRDDAYDPSRTMRNTERGHKRNYYNLEVDDSEHIGEYPYLRQQAEEVIEVLTPVDFVNRLASKSSMGNALYESELTVSPTKHIHSEGLEGLPLALKRYFQDAHTDWGVYKRNIMAYRTKRICPFSAMSSHETHGSRIRMWLNCPGKLECPAVRDYTDVFIPQKALLVWRGDVTHCGLGYLRDNRRHFRYIGVRGFPSGFHPYDNAVLLSTDFTKESQDILKDSLPK